MNTSIIYFDETAAQDICIIKAKNKKNKKNKPVFVSRKKKSKPRCKPAPKGIFVEKKTIKEIFLDDQFDDEDYGLE